MNWYHAANGQQSGPFTDEQFRALIASGTVQPTTLVWETRLPNWIPLAQVPSEVLPSAAPSGAFASAPTATGDGVLCAECGKSFAPDEVIRLADRHVCAACKPILVQRLSEGAAPASVAGVWINEEQLLEREYRVEIGTTLERGWNLFKNNVGSVIGATLLAGLVFIAGYAVTAGAAAVIPAMNFLNVFIQPLFIGPLTGGLLWYFLRLARGESATIGDVFAGFSQCFLQLFLATLVQTLLMVACLIPVGLVAGIGAFTLSSGGNPWGGAGVGFILGLVLGGLISLGAIVYFSICWTHSVLLIMDKRMNFWPAMRLSRKMVSKSWGNWGMTFLFLLVAGIISSAGALACLVGLLVTIPVYFAMKVYFYDDNFRDLQPTQTN